MSSLSLAELFASDFDDCKCIIWPCGSAATCDGTDGGLGGNGELVACTPIKADDGTEDVDDNDDGDNDVAAIFPDPVCAL